MIPPYILRKFNEIRSSNPGVYDVIMSTAGVDQNSDLFCYYFSLGATLLGRADYTLGFATHF